MQISIRVSKVGLEKIKCLTCAQPMRLVGIESHPTIADIVDLVTFECACGEVVAGPRMPPLEFDAAAEAR